MPRLGGHEAVVGFLNKEQQHEEPRRPLVRYSWVQEHKMVEHRPSCIQSIIRADPVEGNDLHPVVIGESPNLQVHCSLKNHLARQYQVPMDARKTRVS